MEIATLHPRVSGFKLHNDVWLNWCSAVLVGMWNIGSLSVKGRNVCEEPRKRMIDVCCFQELRWRRQSVRMLGLKGRRYKLWLSGKGDGVDDVGVNYGDGGAV